MTSSIRHVSGFGMAMLCGVASLLAQQQSVDPGVLDPVEQVSSGSDRIIVKFKPGAAKRAEAVNGRQGTQTVKRLSRNLGIDLVRIPRGQKIEKVLTRLNKDPDVEYAEPDYVIYISQTPNDPKYLDGTLWGLNNTGQNSGTLDADIDAPEAWDVRSSADGIIVAVLDSGIRYTHQDLAANMWTNPGEIPGNGIDDDGNGYIDDVHGINTIADRNSSLAGDCMDDNNHGTHVSGTIGAVSDNGVGLCGVARNVRLMGVKFISAGGSGMTSDAIEGFDYLRTMGAKIVNCSWGGGGYSQALFDAMKACRDAGIIIVAAAGNDSEDVDSRPHFPAGYLLDNVVTVAASTRKDAKASFSNYGRGSVHLFAPGESIYSSVASADNAYSTFSGTSMATPHVAGALALMEAQFPGESYQRVVNRMINGADVISGLKKYSMTGGRLNLYGALTSTNYRPSNDDFAKPVTLTTSEGSMARGSNTEAGKETSEPNHAGLPGGHSVWFTWTAPISGTAVVSTAGSDFDTILGIYTGTKVSSLTLVASNDNDSEGGVTSAATFQAIAGKLYRIAVDGAGGATGLIVVNASIPPINDDFSASEMLSGAAATVTTDNLGATFEAGEPAHAGSLATHSIWYQWTAPADGVYVIDTAGSNFDTVLGVYTGNSVGSLETVAFSDDVNLGTIRTSRAAIQAATGDVYRIAVDGWNGFTGNVQLNIASSGSGWLGFTVGDTTNNSASHTYDSGSGTFTLQRTGGSLSGEVDDFYMACQVLKGDGEIQARVTGFVATRNTGMAGIMIRSGLDNYNAHALLGVSSKGTDISFVHRDVIGANAVNEITLPAATPVWLRLVRAGTTVTAYTSPDGSSWTQMGGTATIPMENLVEVGLVVGGTGTTTMTVDNVTVDFTGVSTPPDDDPPDTPAAPEVVIAGCRLTHVGAGDFDLPTPATSTATPSGEAPSIECRTVPSRKLKMVFQFDKPISSATAVVVAGAGYLDGVVLYSGNEVIVPLRLVNDMETIQIGLSEITAADGSVLTAATARLSMLRGDVDGDGTVTQTDANLVSAAIGQPVNASTAFYDIDLSGVIDVNDVNKVNARLGSALLP